MNSACTQQKGKNKVQRYRTEHCVGNKQERDRQRHSKENSKCEIVEIPLSAQSTTNFSVLLKSGENGSIRNASTASRRECLHRHSQLVGRNLRSPQHHAGDPKKKKNTTKTMKQTHSATMRTFLHPHKRRQSKKKKKNDRQMLCSRDVRNEEGERQCVSRSTTPPPSKYTSWYIHTACCFQRRKTTPSPSLLFYLHLPLLACAAEATNCKGNPWFQRHHGRREGNTSSFNMFLPSHVLQSSPMPVTIHPVWYPCRPANTKKSALNREHKSTLCAEDVCG